MLQEEVKNENKNRICRDCKSCFVLFGVNIMLAVSSPFCQSITLLWTIGRFFISDIPISFLLSPVVWNWTEDKLWPDRRQLGTNWGSQLEWLKPYDLLYTGSWRFYWLLFLLTSTTKISIISWFFLFFLEESLKMERI